MTDRSVVELGRGLHSLIKALQKPLRVLLLLNKTLPLILAPFSSLPVGNDRVQIEHSPPTAPPPLQAFCPTRAREDIGVTMTICITTIITPVVCAISPLLAF